MTAPDVSVLIPAHNEGHWLERTVRAVRSATRHRSYEIVVVDDGSSDGSCSFLRARNAHSGRVRCVRGRGLGVAGARALGAKHARAPHLVFIDAHVLPAPGWLGVMLAMLVDPSVGLAGVEVRDVNNEDYVGHAYVPANANLNAAWVAPRGAAPYEVPAVIGCCVGIRRETYHAMGGFDPGSVSWGVDDIELSLRAWRMGYRCLVSPEVHVAHWFKDNADRSYAISWEDYDVNLLRCAFTYFRGPRLAGILANAAQRRSFRRSLARVHRDREFWRRRAWLQSRFSRGEAWYFERFAPELAPMENRLRKALQDQRRRQSMRIEKNVSCPQCGAKNLGVQERCLLCQAPLPTPEAARAALAEQGQKTDRSHCSNCGEALKPDVRFCTTCGHPVESA